MKCELINYTKVIKGKVILNSINFKIESNKIYGIIGHNGSGKTMLLRAISNLIVQDNGERNVDDDIEFGVIIENPGFMNHLSAYENLAYLAKIRNRIGKNEILKSLDTVNLSKFVNNKVKTFSLGMIKKLGIAQAIMESPRILLLDEPFNALDDNSRDQIKRFLTEYRNYYKSSIVLVSHHKDDLEGLCDSIYKMEEGILSEYL